MDKIKIGLSNKEYAIIIEQKNRRGTTYEAVKIVKGCYNEKNAFFIDETGECYLHFIEYIPTEKAEQYFLGRLKITEYFEKTIGDNLDNFLEEYLHSFQKYMFQCRTNGVICIDKETGKRQLYSDDIIDTEISIKAEIAYTLENLIGNIIEQTQEESEYEQHENEPQEETKIIKIVPNSKNKTAINKTPLQIFSETKESVKGQDEALKLIITNIYQCLKFNNGSKNNMLIIGPTGVGKTFIFEVLSKILNLPLIIFSVPGLTQSGFVGKSVDDILVQLITSCNGDLEKAERGIIILDEIDKIASSNNSNSKIADEGVQNELLKLVEGDKRLITIGSGMNKQEVEFDSSNVIFVGTGAFQSIFNEKPEKHLGFGQTIEPPKITHKITEEVLANNGIKKELIGRMPLVIQLRKLEEHDLCDIILNSKKSRLKSIERLITEECNIQITNLDDIVHKIAKDAISKDIGARGINATVANIMNNIYYEIFNHPNEYQELTFGPNILTDTSDFKLIRKSPVKVKKLTKRME